MLSLEDQKLVLNHSFSNTILIAVLILSQICFGIQNKDVKADSIDYYQNKGNAIKALTFARKKSSYFLNKKDFKSFCEVMQKKAKIYFEYRDVENSLKTLYEAKDIAEKNKLQYELSKIYRLIGAYNGIIFEYSKAKKYLKKSEEVAKKINDNYLLCSTYQSFFKIHTEIQSDSVGYYLKKVDEYSKKSKNLKQIQNNLTNKFLYYFEKKEINLSKKYLDSSYTLANQIKDINLILRAKNNLGVYYMTIEKKYDKAIIIYKEILEIQKKIKIINC